MIPAPPQLPVQSTFSRTSTCQALHSAKVSPERIWAFSETGVFVQDASRHTHSQETLNQWDSSVARFLDADMETRATLLDNVLKEKQ